MRGRRQPLSNQNTQSNLLISRGGWIVSRIQKQFMEEGKRELFEEGKIE